MCSDVQNSNFLPYFLLSTLAKGSLKSLLCSCPHLVFSNLVHVQTNGTYVVVARLARALIRGIFMFCPMYEYNQIVCNNLSIYHFSLLTFNCLHLNCLHCLQPIQIQAHLQSGPWFSNSLFIYWLIGSLAKQMNANALPSPNSGGFRNLYCLMHNNRYSIRYCCGS